MKIFTKLLIATSFLSFIKAILDIDFNNLSLLKCVRLFLNSVNLVLGILLIIQNINEKQK